MSETLKENIYQKNKHEQGLGLLPQDFR